MQQILFRADEKFVPRAPADASLALAERLLLFGFEDFEDD